MRIPKVPFWKSWRRPNRLTQHDKSLAAAAVVAFLLLDNAFAVNRNGGIVGGKHGGGGGGGGDVGGIPQHRVKATRRNVSYGPNHPWNKKEEDASVTTTNGVATEMGRGEGRTLVGIEPEQEMEEDEEGEGESEEDGYSNLLQNWTVVSSPKSASSSFSPPIETSNSTEVLLEHKPIRIRASFINHISSGVTYLTPNQRDYILNSIIQPALTTWSHALSVIPIQDSLVIDFNQLYDGVSCGPGFTSPLPSVVVPPEHGMEQIGIPNTDLMIYLSVAFRPSEMVEKDRFTGSYMTPESLMDDEFFGLYNYNEEDHLGRESDESEFVYEESLGPFGGVGGGAFRGSVGGNGDSTSTSSPQEDEQEVMEPNGLNSSVTSSSTTQTPLEDEKVEPTCTGSYLASATYCSTDQFDRPIAGMLHLCIGHDFFKEEHLEQHVITATHELGHILGFNAQSLAHFRNHETGKPITKRDENSNVKDVLVECTGVTKNRGYATIPLPSTDILKFKTVRNGVRVAQIVTPNVRQIVRNQFDCQMLEGAELESESYHPASESNSGDKYVDEFLGLEEHHMEAHGICISDHWERRLFKSDMMNPIVDPITSSNLISPLTLAYFMDSGWYKVDASQAAEADSWGRASGCTFVEDTCLNEDGLVTSSNSPFFCSPDSSSEEISGCTDDLIRKASCAIYQFDSPLPVEYQYFENADTEMIGAALGGGDADLDYCPVYTAKTPLTDDPPLPSCKEEESKDWKVKRGEVFGISNSRCVTAQVDSERTGLCVPIACAVTERMLKVQVDGYWKDCETEGQLLQRWWNPNDFVICPSPVRACPALFCPKNCLNEESVGVCDYEMGSCLWNRTYNSTSEQVNNLGDEFNLNEQYFSNSTGLEDEEKNVFDITVRMFNLMNPGEIIGFVACSLFFVVSFVIGTPYIVRAANGVVGFVSNPGQWTWRRRQRNQWRVDIPWPLRLTDTSSFDDENTDNNRNKDKMIATVLTDLRVNDPHNVPAITSNHKSPLFKTEADSSKGDILADALETNVDLPQRTILRSELPPLPGVGRVVSIIGSRFVNDSVILEEQRDSLSTIQNSDNMTTNLDEVSILNTATSDSGVEAHHIEEGNCEGLFEGLRPRRRHTQFDNKF